MGEAERLAEVLSHALTDADEWVKSAEVANLVDAVLASDWLAAHVAAARAEGARDARRRKYCGCAWCCSTVEPEKRGETHQRTCYPKPAALLAENPGSDT